MPPQVQVQPRARRDSQTEPTRSTSSQDVEDHLDERGVPQVNPVGPLQTPAWFAQQQQRGRIPQEITPQLFAQEFMATFLGYKDPRVRDGEDGYDPKKHYTPRDIDLLHAWGFKAPNVSDRVDHDDGLSTSSDYIKDEHSGLAVTRFDRLDDVSGVHASAQDLDAQVAFRGTADIGGVRSDTGMEIGQDQYQGRKGLIRDMIRRDGTVGISGHSLGGAMAQHAAADNADHTSQLTTFQGAGVGLGTKFKGQKGSFGVDHFEAGQDIVHRVGMGKIDGTYHTVNRNKQNLTDGLFDGNELNAGAILDGHTHNFAFDTSLQQEGKKGRLEDTFAGGGHWTHGGSNVSAGRRLMMEGHRHVVGGGLHMAGDVSKTWAGTKRKLAASQGKADTAKAFASGAGHLAVDVGGGLAKMGGRMAVGLGMSTVGGGMVGARAGMKYGGGKHAWEGTKSAWNKAKDADKWYQKAGWGLAAGAGLIGTGVAGAVGGVVGAGLGTAAGATVGAGAAALSGLGAVGGVLGAAGGAVVGAGSSAKRSIKSAGKSLKSGGKSMWGGMKRMGRGMRNRFRRNRD